MSAFPSFILPSSSRSASPHWPSDSGSPILAARTIVHLHCSGGRNPFTPRKRLRHMRSKEALNAVLMTDGSVSADSISVGRLSPMEVYTADRPVATCRRSADGDSRITRFS